MARYRRKRLTKGERTAAAASSLAIGAGIAAAAYYVTRILLSREELPQPVLRGTKRDAALPPGPESDVAQES
ncbi:MAG: hypothetical protein AAF389_06925 [Gemmatimonadota bacterium]